MVTGPHRRCPLPPTLTLPLGRIDRGGGREGGGDAFDAFFATFGFIERFFLISADFNPKLIKSMEIVRKVYNFFKNIYLS
jgi:hypothetical protein